MKTFEVWTEGFIVTGDYGTATLRGTVDAIDFDAACIKVLGDKLDKDESTKDGYRRSGNGNYSYWACRCFDNEAEARKSFG